MVNCWGIGYNPGYRFFKTHKGERNDTFAPPHEFGNRTNLTAFCAAFVRVFSRLFSPQLFAVAAVLCGALSAQSASAYGALYSKRYDVSSFAGYTFGQVVNAATKAAARSSALTTCQNASVPSSGSNVQPCELLLEFQGECISTTRAALTNVNTAILYGTGSTEAAAVANRISKQPANFAGNVGTQTVCDTTGSPPTCNGGTVSDTTNACECSGSTPDLFGGTCMAACTSGTPVRDSVSGNCRARQASDCTGNTPILDSGSCRAATQADCTGGTPIFENGNCRARQQSDCTGNTPILDSGNCRARQAGDCTGNTPILDGGNCRARQAGDCTGNTPILDGGNCRARQASDCTGNTPILDSGSCRAATQADCTGGTPILDSGACRARQQSDCTGNTPILDSGSCRAATQADCTGNRPIFENGNCRARQASDCTGATPILHNGACVATRPTPPTTGSASSDDDKKARFNRLEVASGFVAIAGAIYAFSLYGGVPFFEAVQWSPHYNFAMSDGVRRYEVGSRWEWKHDNLSAHWTATKTASDSFAYGSGAKWTGDIFTAAFNSQETGKDTELDFSLLAKKEFGVWSFSPQYRVNFDRDETDETWRHSLALRAVWTADKWTLSNAAGFHGKSLAAFGDNASAKVLLRREF